MNTRVDGGDRAVTGASAPAALLQALEHLAPRVRTLRAEADAHRALAPAVVRAVLDAGFLRGWVPRSAGGLELALPQALDLYRAAARIDGTLGWTVMIGAGGGLFGAWLDAATAREIFGHAEAVVAGSGAPDGRAERVAGGYRVSGCWRFASGAPWASVFTANCIVTEAGEPVVADEGTPLVRAMCFEPPAVTIIESWNPLGLRGTASHDFRVTDVFVPERRSFSLAEAPREAGALYRLPFAVLTELPVASVALGIAAQALAAFAGLARRKRVQPGGGLLAGDATACAAFARAQAAWTFAVRGLDDVAARAWATVVAGGEAGAALCAEVTAASAHAVTTLRAEVDALAALAGMPAVACDDDLARAWRDLVTLAAHYSVSPRQSGNAGGVLLAATAARAGPAGAA